MRRILRRRKNDADAVTWSDDDLNEVLAFGLYSLQNEIMKVDPHFVVSRATAQLTDGQRRYPKPEGMWLEISLGIADTAEPTGYRYLDRKDYGAVLRRRSGEDPIYSHYGDYFEIAPEPATTIAAGLEVNYVPTLTMALDTDVPRCHIALQPAVVFWADLFLGGESKEDPARTEGMLNRLVNMIPQFYYRHGQKAEQFQVQGLNKPRRYSPKTQRRSPDWDTRG